MEERKKNTRLAPVNCYTLSPTLTCLAFLTLTLIPSSRCEY
jgi:hypothetical protein